MYVVSPIGNLELSSWIVSQKTLRIKIGKTGSGEKIILHFMLKSLLHKEPWNHFHPIYFPPPKYFAMFSSLIGIRCSRMFPLSSSCRSNADQEKVFNYKSFKKRKVAKSSKLNFLKLQNKFGAITKNSLNPDVDGRCDVPSYLLWFNVKFRKLQSTLSTK